MPYVPKRLMRLYLYIHYVLTYIYVLRTYVHMYLTYLRACCFTCLLGDLPLLNYVPTQLRTFVFLRLYVSTCLCVMNAYVPFCFQCLPAYTHYFFAYLCVGMPLCFLHERYYVYTCIRAYVPIYVLTSQSFLVYPCVEFQWKQETFFRKCKSQV